MPTCEERIASLIDHAGGQLSPQQRTELESHLAGCGVCTRELELIRSGTELMIATRSEPHPLSTSAFTKRAAELAEHHRDHSWRGLWWSSPRAVRLCLATSLAAFAGALVLTIGLPSAPSPSPAPTGPAAMIEEARASRSLLNDDDPVTFDHAFDQLTDDELETLDQLLDLSHT